MVLRDVPAKMPAANASSLTQPKQEASFDNLASATEDKSLV